MSGRIIVLAALFVTASGFCAEIKFVSAPSASKSGNSSRISFTVSAPTDVEVAVIAADGKVIRHLAAGVLGGENPPPDPLKPGLSQTIDWDGLDDAHKPAAGPCKFRVRAGTRATLGTLLGFDPYRMPFVHGLSVDDAGNLYVLFRNEFNHGGGTMHMRVFDREGKYLRTIMPYSGELPSEKVSGFGLLTDKANDAGYLYPTNFDTLTPKIYHCSQTEDIGLIGNRVRGGRVLMFLASSGSIVQIGTDGSCSGKDWEIGQLWARWGQSPIDLHTPSAGKDFGPMTWGLSPDGKKLFVAGYESESKPTANYSWAAGRIHKIDLTKPLLPLQPSGGVFPAETFVDTQPSGTAPSGQPRASWGLFSGLAKVMGVDVADDGTVCVCDRGNKRIAAYDPQGKLIGSTAVEDPDAIAVHPKTKEVYVLTRKQPAATTLSFALIKLSNATNGKELARFNFKDAGRSAGSLALDVSGATPVVWVAGPGGENHLFRIDDQGSAFQISSEFSQKTSADGLNATVYCFANPVNDQLYIQDGEGNMTRIDGLTGKALPGWKNTCGRPSSALDTAFDLEGNVYLSGYSGYMSHVTRFSPDMQQLALVSAKETAGKQVYGRRGVGESQKGVAVGPDGRIYAHHMLEWNKYVISSWKPDGSPDQEEVFAIGTGTTGGVKIDLSNNVYVALTGVPKGYHGPVCHGSIIKVPADKTKDAGLKPAEPGQMWTWGPTSSGEKMGFMHGASVIYPGIAPMMNRAGSCVCKEARFDLDKFGRLYIPNTLTYSVQIVDNAGNEIARFGHYGNADSPASDKSSAKKPEIPLGWPMTVAATDSAHVYVGDCLNTRVVRVDLKFAAEEICAIK